MILNKSQVDKFSKIYSRYRYNKILYVYVHIYTYFKKLYKKYKILFFIKKMEIVAEDINIFNIKKYK